MVVKNSMEKVSGGVKASELNKDNEAEFQASIIEEIRKAFPLLPSDIRAERYLHLKLGHHEVVVDGASTDRKTVKGRWDVAVFQNDAPLLLAELKAPNVEITDEDVDQGLSYARLHRPMVPLVLVTNGDPTATRLIHSYDGSNVSTDSDLSKVIKSASVLAVAAVEGAIRNLLGSDPKVWRKILDRWNSEGIANRSGATSDFRCAIAENFQIPREAVNEVSQCLSKGVPVIVLHGPPLSGVTCAMAQLVKALSDTQCAYIDSRSAGDVLQFISSRLSRELSIGISKDDLRQWLNTGQSLPGLTLLIDGVPSGAIEELLHIAEAGSLRVVFGLDSWVFASLSTHPGRPEETLLARLAHEVKLTELSASEFDVACEMLWDSFNANFLPGAKVVADLRLPRNLRIIGSQIRTNVPRKIRQTESGEEYVATAIPPISTFQMLKHASSIFGADPQLKHDLSRLSSAYLADVRKNGSDPDFVVETFGIPSINPDVLEITLGEHRIQRLSDQGIIHWTDTRSLGPRIVVRLPELLAHHVSLLWTSELNEATNDEVALEKLNDILCQAHLVPYGDLCAAAAIARVHDGKRLHAIYCTLCEHTPQEFRLQEGAVIELLTTDQKGIRLHFGEGMDDRLPGDMLPWIILSHLAAIPADFGDNSISSNMVIFARIGNSEDLIWKPPAGRMRDMVGLHIHNVPGIGPLLCQSSGIIEPLLQAMYFHAMWRPEEFEQLVELALKEKQVFFAWRLITVARIVRTSTVTQASEAASRAYTTLSEWWSKTFGAGMSH